MVARASLGISANQPGQDQNYLTGIHAELSR
jgi:hypothetical protein